MRNGCNTKQGEVNFNVAKCFELSATSITCTCADGYAYANQDTSPGFATPPTISQASITVADPGDGANWTGVCTRMCLYFFPVIQLCQPSICVITPQQFFRPVTQELPLIPELKSVFLVIQELLL